MEGTNIAINKQVTVKDDKFPDTFIDGWDNGFANMKNTDKIEFGLDETKHVFYNSDFSVELTFDVIATDRLNQQQTFTNKKLTIIYKKNGSYTDKTQLVFEGFVKLDVIITNVNSKNLVTNATITTPHELFLETEIETTRNYLFYSKNAPNSDVTSLNWTEINPCLSANAAELEIYWDYVPGVEEYELEWTWVNDYTGSALEYDFKYDATRIITKNTFYRIPLTYEKGFIVYRLRHIGRGGANFTQRVEGPWTDFPEKDLIANYPSNLKYHVNSYATDNINWSSTFTFDENGRKGSGVSFMDGMLMGRQSIAKLNTENKVIAQSVIYDYQGRPAISILPVPLNNECLNYQNALNNNASGTAYIQSNFDKDAEVVCDNATDVLNVNAGASNYYSAANTNKEGAQGYLPVADGLPFVQVEYTSDMTGRIKSQTMPGPAHKLGTGKETKFFYSNPGDGELYQLFGSEVGNVKHYDKNIVSDANGQLSSSYIDMEGRVVATSLLGPKPANVDNIEDYDSSVPLTDNLLNYNIVDIDNHSLTSVKNIFIEQAGATQTFTYEFMPEDFTDACVPALCFDCIYEFEFKITDNCNANLIAPVTATVGNLTNNLQSCDDPSLKYELSPGSPLSVVFPNVGNYVITKTLKVSAINLDEYLDIYIAKNTCFDSYETILQDQMNAIDFSSCNTDCQSCSTSVASYITAYPSTHPGKTITDDEISRLYQECAALCQDQLDPCFMAKQQMLQDFHPDGQYAGYLVDNVTNVYSSSGNTSILSSSNKLGISYTNSTLNYVDANGVSVLVEVFRSGQLFKLPVYSLTIEEFVTNFQPSWANAFLDFHPEKCYLDFCETNAASEKYDYGMLQVNTYDEAVEKGYFKPLSTISLPAMCGSGSVSNYDPFFTTGGQGNHSNNSIETSSFYGSNSFDDEKGNTFLSVGQTYTTLMGLAFNNFYPTSSASAPNANMFELAKVMGREGSTSTANLGCEPCTKDNEWLAFRGLYLKLKMILVTQRKTDYVIENGCFNGCMQNSGFQPFVANSTSLKFIPYNLLHTPTVFNNYPFYSFGAYPLSTLPNAFSNPAFMLHDGYFQTQTTGKNPCASAADGAFNIKTARFQQLPLSTTNLLDYYTNLLANNPNSGTSVLPATVPPATGNLGTNFCQNTCQSYAEQWINKLKNCNPIFDIEDDDFDLAANVTIRNQIMTEMVNVCVNGCDAENPFGSSTVNPDLTPVPVYTSFQEVINHFAIVYPAIIPYPTSLFCSSLNVLDFPMPYNHDYSGNNNGAQNKLDTCGCNQVLATQTKFNQLFSAGTLPAGVTTIEQYFEYKYNTPIYNFNDLACKCSVTAPEWTPTYVWSAGQSTALLSNNIPVPEVLSCSKCLSCQMLSNALQELHDKSYGYGGTLSDQFIENYLNSTLNMNLSFSDYMDFLNNSCGENATLACNLTTLTSGMTDLVNSYITIAKAQPNTGPVSITISSTSNPEFFNSCLFGCSSELIIPNILTLGIPYNASAGGLQYNIPTLTYSYGDFGEFNCSPRFNSILPAFLPGVTGYVVSNVVFGTNVSAYNASLEGQYYLGGVLHVFNAANRNTYFNFPCLDLDCLNQIESPATLCNKSISTTLPIYEDCMTSMMNQAETNARLIYQSYVDKYSAEFKKKYYQKCMLATETYKREYSMNEYHYTLYYYDQAGNLVRTVAPKGVHKLTTAQVTLLQSATPPVIYPAHTYVTNYKYQSYGAPLDSKTPDETDKTEYLYDNIGRIQLSCNAQQKADGRYSYTLYDELGRIEEVGVLTHVPSSITLADFKTAISLNDFRDFIDNLPSQCTRNEVISTYYDTPLNNTISGQFGTTGQTNLRNRVVSVTYEDVFDNDINTYNYATHYTYDEHGNVGKIIQDMASLDQIKKRYYKMDYEYDLISGNVNKVTYQKGSSDQFMHKYEYDADNRLHNVYTSKDNVNWDRDAKYFYYEHGPLARTELGDQQVQGTDFAYTIHGWIKSVNSNILSENTDMGKDGATGNKYLSDQYNLHQFVGKDAAGYSLNYYQNNLKDYQSIKTFNSTDNRNMLADLSAINSTGTPFNLTDDAPDLFNGNISSMVTSIYDMDINANNTHEAGTAFPQITGYRYDQLHRIKQMKAFRDVNLTTNQWNAATAGNYDGSYFTQFTYDKNGNIKTQKRDGAAFMTGLGLEMDDLTYLTEDASTTNPTNKLIGVNDAATGTYVTDIKGLTTSADYEYDNIGSLITDDKEFIVDIVWTVDRKVKKVIREGAAMVAQNKNMPDLEFEYDANRQRVVKIVKPHDEAGVLRSQNNWVYTYYVRDASGNITATYNKKFIPLSGQTNAYTEILTLQEHDIYGSSRLGTLPDNLEMGSKTFTATLSEGIFQDIVYSTAIPPLNQLCTYSYETLEGIIMLPCPVKYDRTVGNKRYELTNHLGNVLTVVSDRKLQQSGNTTNLSNDYEMTFNNQDNTHVSAGSYSCKLVDAFSPGMQTQVNLGDALTASVETYYTAPLPTGVTSAGLLIISFVDANGNFLYNASGTTQWYSAPASTTANSWQPLTLNVTVPTNLYMDAAHTMLYTGSIFANSHIWNPNATVELWVDNHALNIITAIPMVVNYKAEILETKDTYPFGYEMAGRSVGQDYNFSFNGKLDDSKDGWQTQDYGFRSYDKRLGRFFSEDPLTGFYSYLSPYAFAANRCIEGIDLEGGEFLRKSAIKFAYSPILALEVNENKAKGNIAMLDANNLFVKYKALSVLMTLSNATGDGEDDGVSKGWVVNKYGIQGIAYKTSFNKKSGTSKLLQNKGTGIIEFKEYTHPVSKGEAVGIASEIVAHYQQKLGAAAAWDYYYLNQIDKKAFYEAAEVVNNAIDLGLVHPDYAKGTNLTDLYNAVLSDDFKNDIAQKTGDLYLKQIAEYIYENMGMINKGLDPTKTQNIIERVKNPFRKFGFDFKMTKYQGKSAPEKPTSHQNARFLD